MIVVHPWHTALGMMLGTHWALTPSLAHWLRRQQQRPCSPGLAHSTPQLLAVPNTSTSALGASLSRRPFNFLLGLIVSVYTLYSL